MSYAVTMVRIDVTFQDSFRGLKCSRHAEQALDIRL